ncbi:MAG: phosphate signaling complex protein PhoU [Synergistaceae bacterium]|nr:phosphate signaling complex protein PhoU [Synergistaceae bacterium]
MKNSMNDVAVTGEKTFITEKYLYASDKERLVDLVVKMAEEALKSIVTSIESLIEADDTKARSVIERDDVIDAMEEKIDQECLYTIAMRQPMREDLRFVYAVTKIITDIERIGDLSESIAECSLKLSLKTEEIKESLYFSESKPFSEEILSMCSQIETMFSKLIAAFVNEDEVIAHEVMGMCALFNETGKKTVNAILTSRENLSRNLEVFTNVIWILRYLDRVGGHLMNIAERVCFIVTGVTSEFLKKKQKAVKTNNA